MLGEGNIWQLWEDWLPLGDSSGLEESEEEEEEGHSSEYVSSPPGTIDMTPRATDTNCQDSSP